MTDLPFSCCSLIQFFAFLKRFELKPPHKPRSEELIIKRLILEFSLPVKISGKSELFLVLPAKEERIKLKHLSNDKNDLLNEKFDNLSTKSFKEKDVILEIVKEQNAKSILARGDEELETDHTTSEFKKSESLDIRLHESLRIVSDWIFIRNENELSQSTNPMDKEI